MTVTSALQHEIRQLLLPISPSPEAEPAAVAAVAQRLKKLGIDESDHSERLRQLRENWHRSGAIMPHDLRDLVRRAIRAGFPEADHRFAQEFPTTHLDLQKQHVMSFEDAAALLSQAPMIRQLAVDQRMSASAIAKVLAARGAGSDVAWRAVAKVLSALRAKPTLVSGSPADEGTLEWLRAQDMAQADGRFLDADIEAGAELVGTVGTELGFRADLTDLLQVLCTPDGDTFAPYLQVLHFQCSIAAFLDHPVTMIYEFSPRGGNTAFLLETYEPLVGTLNAFLNNMKAVERLDGAWARSRKEHRARAHALVAVLDGMETMAFLPRAELAMWIRQWLLRVIVQSAPPPNPVPEHATAASVDRAMAALVADPSGTHTGGVIEQRIVDALASTIHREADGWRPRGLGLPVHASNLSSRRLGDCDFQIAAAPGGPEIVAYEATAGRLTSTYLAGHLQTLRRSIAARGEELDAIADRGSWRARVVFVAHEFAADLPAPGALPEADYAGVAVEVEHVTFTELRDRAHNAHVVAAFTERVHAQLNQARTPRSAREKFLAMLA